MREQDELPRGATLYYNVLKGLDISVAEYMYLDMIYHLSRNSLGYCYKSLDSIASDMNVSKNGVIKMRDRLATRGLVKKNRKGYVCTTEMYHKVVRSGGSTYHKVTKSYHKVVPTVPQSSTKIYNRNTVELGDGYQKARNMADLLRTRRLDRSDAQFP